MSRKSFKSKSKNISPDPIFNSVELAKLINSIMLNGKKAIVAKSTYSALEVVSKSKTLSKVEFFKDKTSVQPLEIFNYIISAVKPSVIVKSRRVGGSTYQVPHVMEGDPVREKRAVSYAIRWIAGAIKSKSGAELSKKILSEFEDILNGRGSSLKKKEDQFKLAEANRPFAHFDNQNHSRRY